MLGWGHDTNFICTFYTSIINWNEFTMKTQSRIFTGYDGFLEILLQNNSVVSLIINANQIFTSKQKWQ